MFESHQNITFDTNCVIALDEGEAAAPYLHRIVKGATDQGLRLRVVGISASERQQNGKSASFRDFEARVARVGLEGVEILLPPGIWGMTFWDKCTWGPHQSAHQAKEIHEILFPDTPFEYGDFCRKFDVDPSATPVHKKWRNRVIDTWALWQHMDSGGGVFITSDKNFNTPKKKRSLARLGAGEILRPEEAAERLCQG